jgi:hypothetical protein
MTTSQLHRDTLQMRSPYPQLINETRVTTT